MFEQTAEHAHHDEPRTIARPAVAALRSAPDNPIANKSANPVADDDNRKTRSA